MRRLADQPDLQPRRIADAVRSAQLPAPLLSEIAQTLAVSLTRTFDENPASTLALLPLIVALLAQAGSQSPDRDCVAMVIKAFNLPGASRARSWSDKLRYVGTHKDLLESAAVVEVVVTGTAKLGGTFSFCGASIHMLFIYSYSHFLVFLFVFVFVFVEQMLLAVSPVQALRLRCV